MGRSHGTARALLPKLGDHHRRPGREDDQQAPRRRLPTPHRQAQHLCGRGGLDRPHRRPPCRPQGPRHPPADSGATQPASQAVAQPTPVWSGSARAGRGAIGSPMASASDRSANNRHYKHKGTPITHERVLRFGQVAAAEEEPGQQGQDGPTTSATKMPRAAPRTTAFPTSGLKGGGAPDLRLGDASSSVGRRFKPDLTQHTFARVSR